jgi:hypothetical protein
MGAIGLAVGGKRAELVARGGSEGFGLASGHLIELQQGYAGFGGEGANLFDEGDQSVGLKVADRGETAPDD